MGSTELAANLFRATQTEEKLRRENNPRKSGGKSVYNLQYNDLRAYHIKECIDFCELSYPSKNAIRTLFVNLDKFALERDIIDKCYSALVPSVSIPQTSKEPDSTKR